MSKQASRNREWTDEYTLLCEKCGYVIEELDITGRCPECGKPIEESLPERRVGTPWQQDPGLKSLIQTWWMTLRHPFRTLDVMQFHSSTPITPLSATLFYTITICIGLLMIEPIPRALNVALNFLLWIVVGVVIWCMFFVLSLIEAYGLQFFGKRRGFRINPAMSWVIVGHGAIGWTFTGLIWTLGWKIARILYHQNPQGLTKHELIQQINQHTTYIFIPAFVVGLSIGLFIFECFAYLGLRRCKFANRMKPEGIVDE